MIPHGRVTTYGAIANYLALPSPRMVGFALKNSTLIDGLPAHRVVNRNGELTGKLSFPTPTYMQEMLESEGIEVKDNKIVNFKKLYWQPCS